MRRPRLCLENIVNLRDVVLYLPEGGGLDSKLEVEGFQNITHGGSCDVPEQAAGFLGDGPRRGPELPPLVTASSAGAKSGANERPDLNH